MFNYNREVIEAEVYRADKRHAASTRQVPYGLRSSTRKVVQSWLSKNVFMPFQAQLTNYSTKVVSRAGRTWRRMSSRAVGLVVNTFRQFTDLVLE